MPAPVPAWSFSARMLPRSAPSAPRPVWPRSHPPPESPSGRPARSPRVPADSRSTPFGTPIGTVWTLGLREVTVVRDTWAVLAELPATGIPDGAAAAMDAATVSLLERAGFEGGAVVHFALEHDGTFAVTEVDTDGRATHVAGGALRRRHPRHAPAGRPG